jgi:hypothetical protein
MPAASLSVGQKQVAPARLATPTGQGDQFRWGLGSPTMSFGPKDTTQQSRPTVLGDRLAEVRRWP